MFKQIDINQQFHRSISIDGLDKKNRTVEVSFSSEIEVERYFGIEILDHSVGAVRLGMLNDGGAVLVDHDTHDHVGVVENARIDADRKGRARLRFGSSQRATEVFNDVVDGIRSKVSVGYKIHKFEVTEGHGSVQDVYRVTDWEPFEISFVAIPADASVGVGRSEDFNNKKEIIEMPKQEQKTQAAQLEQAPAVTSEQVVAAERQRIAEITRAAEVSSVDLSAVRNDAIAGGWSLEKFRSAAFEQLAAQPKPANAVVSTEMLQRNKSEYSLVRAMAAHVSGDWTNAGFEREVSQEMQRQAGAVLGGGIIVPTAIFARSDTTSAGGMIGTTHLGNQFIDVLRGSALLGKLGARFLDGLVGNVSLPKKSSSAEFGWVAEKESAKESDIGVGNVILSPKHISGLVSMTYELMRQSSSSIERIVREDMIAGLALAVDRAAFNGTGLSNQPLGILNTTGVQTRAVADINAPTFADIVAMEGMLDDADALAGSLAYVFRPTIYSALKTTPKDVGNGFVIQGRTCNEYAAHSSTQMPVGGALFGNFADLMIGCWGAIEIIPTRNSSTGGLDVGIHQMCDVVVRHPQSFVKTVAKQ